VEADPPGIGALGEALTSAPAATRAATVAGPSGRWWPRSPGIVAGDQHGPARAGRATIIRAGAHQ